MFRSLPPGKYLASRRSFPPTFASQRDFDIFVNRGVVDTYGPLEPFITHDTQIVTMGSCFAQNIARTLDAKAYNVYRFNVSERLFTAFALRGFLEGLAAEHTDFKLFEENWRVEPAQIIETREHLRQGALVIITLGLSVVWYDNTTGEIIFDPGRKHGGRLIYDNPERFQMRPTTVAANVEAIDGIVRAVQTLNPSNRIVLTLSPIPLTLSMGDYPVVVADTISKSTLRVALHEIFERRAPDLYYWPSFELLKWLAPMVDQIWYEDGLLTHVKHPWIDYTMSKFMQFFCVGHQKEPPPVATFPGSPEIPSEG